MPNWLTRLFSTPAPQADPERLLVLEQELQSLRLERTESQLKITRLAQELERQQTGMSAQIDERLNTQTQKLLAELAAPAAQLLTQIYLDGLAQAQPAGAEQAGKAPRAQDVLAVARRMLRILQNYGLSPEEQPGEISAFDPDRHIPLNAEHTLQPGQAVKIQFCGFSYQGRLIHKAGVSPAGDPQPTEKP